MTIIDKSMGLKDQTGGEQVISLLPTWTSLFLSVAPSGAADNTSSSKDLATYRVGVDISQIKSYKQSLSLRNGIVETTITWEPFDSSSGKDADSIELVYTVLAHRDRPTLGLVRLDVSGLKDGQQVIITDVLDGAGAQRVENEQAGKLNDDELKYGIYSAVNPLGIQNVTAWEISTLEFTGGSNIQETEIPQNIGLGTNKSTAAQAYSLTADKDGSISVFKAVGIASSDAFADKEKSTALASAKEAKKDGWEKLVSEHEDAWETLWSEGGEIEILGAEKSKDNNLLGELQTTTRSSLFHLLSNIRNGNEGTGLGDNSIAPAGLTSDSYAGGIFWDAETWMYPSLLSLFPDYAMSINNYRSKNLGAAMENVKQFNRSGLLYPWVSFRFGNCTGKLLSDTLCEFLFLPKSSFDLTYYS